MPRHLPHAAFAAAYLVSTALGGSSQFATADARPVPSTAAAPEATSARQSIDLAQDAPGARAPTAFVTVEATALTVAPSATTPSVTTPSVTAPPAPAPAPPLLPRPPRGLPDPPPAVALAIARAFPPDQQTAALGVSYCESHWEISDRTSGPWRTNVGPFQVNAVHRGRAASLGYSWAQVRLDPLANAVVAAALWHDQGWAPWSCRSSAHL